MIRYLGRAASMAVAVLLLVGSLGTVTRAQTLFLRGQSVQPVYEGWQKNADGSISMVFGYLNRNYEEEPYIPIGTNNFFEPGAQDQGQPTHFERRRQSFVFEVKLPADWANNKELVWTITANGVTNKAIGSLTPTWVIDEGTWRANRGSGISGRSADEYTLNRPPVAKIVGPTSIKAKVDEEVSLTASATDDGRPGPKPKAPKYRGGGEGGTQAKIVLSNPDLPTLGGPRSNAASGTGGPADQNIVQVGTAAETGLGITWLHYRGPGRVSFSTRASSVKNGEPATTKARFSEPGTYVIRAVADDSSFTSGANVTVIVEAAAAKP